MTDTHAPNHHRTAAVWLGLWEQCGLGSNHYVSSVSYVTEVTYVTICT